MTVRLVWLDAADPQNDILLTDFPVVIGRGSGADLFVDDSWASRVHCLLDVQDGQLRVYDLGSHHGTYVNGRLMLDGPLLPGNTLTVGCTMFAVWYERTAVPASLLDRVRSLMQRGSERLRNWKTCLTSAASRTESPAAVSADHDASLPSS